MEFAIYLGIQTLQLRCSKTFRPALGKIPNSSATGISRACALCQDGFGQESKLGDNYYFADGQFVRDSAYRTIQRGLLNRLPEYREDWKTRQQELVEMAFPTVCARQFSEAAKHRSIFYRDVTTGEWAECDLVMVQDDLLLVLEAKAGAMPMHSPETNFERFERLIGELVVKAYAQCKRFLDYLASAPEVKIYHLADGRYVPAGRLRLRDFRTILPIGLTVEAFTPFSAMVKERPEIKPLLGSTPSFRCPSTISLSLTGFFLPLENFSTISKFANGRRDFQPRRFLTNSIISAHTSVETGSTWISKSTSKRSTSWA